MCSVVTINAKRFPDRADAVNVLFQLGFVPINETRGLYESGDGVLNAAIKRRTRDGQFFIVLFAAN
jgi:hypothetical protein